MLTVGDAQSIFTGCLLLVDGRETYVVSIMDSGKQLLYDVEEQEIRTREGSFDGFEPITARIGFINLLGQAVYMYRTTHRQYKFGLCNRNVANHNPLISDNLFEVALEELRLMRSKAFLKTFKGVFPTLGEARELIQSGASCVAFDRQFAITNMGTIGYKGDHVGSYEGGKIVWADGKSHLEKAIKRGQV